MKTSVVIVSLNGRDRIDLPLRALAAGTPPPDEVIVVDNGSRDGLSRHVRRHHPDVHLVRARHNLGFAGGNNLGIVQATGDVVILLNDDTEPEAAWLLPLVEAFRAAPRRGIAGCQLLYPGGDRIQHLGARVHPNGLTDHDAWGESARQADPADWIPSGYVTGAAFAIRREVIASVGLLDPGYFPIYFEEVDFCERARRARWQIGVVPASRVIHHESQVFGRFSRRFLTLYHRNRLRFLLRNRRLGDWPAVLRAEAAWMIRHRPWDQIWPCALAYAWAPFQFLPPRRSTR